MIRIGACSEHFTVTGQSSHSLAVSEKEKINIGVNSQHCMTGNRSIISKRKSSFGENFRCVWVIFFAGFYCLYFKHINSQKTTTHTLGWKRPVSNSAVFSFWQTRHPHSALAVMHSFNMQLPHLSSPYVLWKLERTYFSFNIILQQRDPPVVFVAKNT